MEGAFHTCGRSIRRFRFSAKNLTGRKVSNFSSFITNFTSFYQLLHTHHLYYHTIWRSWTRQLLEIQPTFSVEGLTILSPTTPLKLPYVPDTFVVISKQCGNQQVDVSLCCLLYIWFSESWQCWALFLLTFSEKRENLQTLYIVQSNQMWDLWETGKRSLIGISTRSKVL